MRWWAVPFAAIGLAHGAGAGELNSQYLRGSIVPTYPVIQVAPPSADDTALAASHAQPVANVPPPVWNWTGFYIGAHVGAAWGITNFSDPFGTSIFADKVTTPGFLAGGQIGYNWQAPNSPWVFGIEADLDWLD